MTEPREYKTIPLTGVPVAYLLKITTGATIAEPGGLTDAAKRFKFDSLADKASLKILKTAASASGEKYEINITGDTIMEFPKTVKRISGTETESDNTTPKNIASTEDEGTGKAEFTLSINGADMDSTSWTAFLDKLKTEKDSYFLLIVPSGFTRQAYVTQRPDGWYYAIVKLSTDIEDKTPLSLSFGTVECSYAAETGFAAAVEALDFETTTGANGYIPWIGVAGSKLRPATAHGNKLAATDTDKMAALIAGDVVIMPTTVWS